MNSDQHNNQSSDNEHDIELDDNNDRSYAIIEAERIEIDSEKCNIENNKEQ